ncbi:unnamed protein product, partial [Meganyctiphanes norvegica]
MADENKAGKGDNVGLFLRAMVDREPGKRKVKPSKAALIDLAELDLGESSDDSDYKVDESKLNDDDDDISINSDPNQDLGSDDDEDEDEADGEGEEMGNGELINVPRNGNISVSELLEQAKRKQEKEGEKGISRPKISVCAVCLGDHSDDLNEIVACDGCSVSVHEGCYGISDAISVSSTVSSCSTEPWFCDACKAGVTNPSCELCPNLGDIFFVRYTIFKETEMGRWVHLVCALYVPGVAFSEVDKLSFPTLFEMPYSRWGSKTCALCEDERYSKTGVCIGCDAGMCRGYFHVTCAQREGLLSEVNHGEADQADPYYAHCKLHTDRELIRRRKRNWLALQLHMKQGEIDRKAESLDVQSRIQRKLLRYRDKYFFNKNNRPTPWFPTQKMPRALSTSASLFRSLLRKTELMGISTESHPSSVAQVGDIRKKWHIPPAFNVEFISYYLDRTTRLDEMKTSLNSMLKEHEKLTIEELNMKDKYTRVEKDYESLKSENDSLLNKALELHDLLKGLAGRPLPLPSVVAALHNPPTPPSASKPMPRANARPTLITKAAAKMMANPYQQNASVGSGLNLNHCCICQRTTDEHLMIECDTCSLYYHLACLDPPLTRMPKKTKQMGWQCSDCCKSSDSDKASEVDTAAPRRLRRNVKEPNKFSPSLTENKNMSVQEMNEKDSLNLSDVIVEGKDEESQPSEPGHLYHPGVATETPKRPLTENPTIGKRRRSSTEGKKTGQKKRRKSQAGETEAEEISEAKEPVDLNVSNSKESTITATTPSKAQKIQIEPTTNSSEKPKGKPVESPTRSSRSRKSHESNNISSSLPAPASMEVTPTSSSAHQNVSTSALGKNTPTSNTTSTSVSTSVTTNTIASTTTNTTNITTTNTISSSSPSLGRLRRSQTDAAKTFDYTSSPSRARRSQQTEALGPLPTEPVKKENQTGGMVNLPAIETDAYHRLRGVSSSHLDTSVESLPSVSSLHSPHSESFHSAEDDPKSPRKEKKHRDGSKKKKKDKDKDKDQEGGKKKKHRHRDKHSMGEMASEMVTPFRIKIKPMPPRPAPVAPAAIPEATSSPQSPVASTHSNDSSPHPNYQTLTTAPEGYPPLPPGYTLTQPMAPPTSTQHLTTSSYSTYSTSVATTSASTTVSSSSSSSASKRKHSDSSEQFSICDVCKETGGVTNTVACDECNKAYHFNCLEPPLKKSPKRRGYSWFCEDCKYGT